MKLHWNDTENMTLDIVIRVSVYEKLINFDTPFKCTSIFIERILFLFS